MPISCALLLLTLLPVQDRVSLAGGETVTGEIRRAGLDSVVLVTADGQQQQFDAGEVVALSFGDVPEGIARARGFLRKQDYQNAVAAFDTAASAGGASWVEPLARLERAEALLAWARIDSSRAAEAAEAFSQWSAAYPDHYLQIRARIDLGRALARAGRVDEGAKALEELSSLAFERNLGKHVELGARLERSIVYLDGGQAQVAETRLRDLVPSMEQAISDPGIGAGVRPQLRDLLSRAQIALGDAIETKAGAGAARPYWQSLESDPRASVDVHAAALAGLARDAAESGKPREAQLLLARVVATLHASPEVMARALYQLAKVTETLGNDVATSRAYYEQILRDHPETSWAVKTRQEVPDLSG